MCEWLLVLNLLIEVEVVFEWVMFENVDVLFEGVDVVLDGLDNFLLCYLFNDVCIKYVKLLVYVVIECFDG